MNKLFLQRTKRININNISKRRIISNPALNTNPAFRNPTFIPFGINFIDNNDKLKNYLIEKNVDIDDIERIYYQQCQQDMEFNNDRLPRSYDSKLWGFIYGQRLINAKYQLQTIRDDEKFLINYLNETINELTMRMNRFYPSFDYKSQIKPLYNNDNNKNEEYDDCYNKALAEIISDDPQLFINKVFKNNAFIPNECNDNDDNDKYNDYLPQQIEQDLINNYQFEWDFNSNLTTNFESYFNRISKIENILSPKIDSLSKNLRKNFADFLLQSFAENNLKDIKYITKLIETSTNSIISSDDDLESLNNEDLVKNSLNLLDESSNSSVLISKLFYGKNGKNIEQELNDKTKDELISILKNTENERLILINKSLKIYEYLKYNSMTRLIITCLINEYNEYFAQFLNENGDKNIEQFENINNNILDEIISFQSIYFQNQEDLINSFNSLTKKIEETVGTKAKINDVLDFDQFQGPKCFVSDIFERNLNLAKEEKNILNQIKYLTYYNYINSFSSSISGLNILLFLMNPTRNGIKGSLLKNMAFQFATSSSDATDSLLDQIIDKLTIGNIDKSSLSSSISNELENFKNIAIQYNNSRENVEENIKNITLNFDSFNFDHAKSNYDPLSTYLAQFKYYDKR